jgi:hypothetical protein
MIHDWSARKLRYVLTNIRGCGGKVGKTNTHELTCLCLWWGIRSGQQWEYIHPRLLKRSYMVALRRLTSNYLRCGSLYIHFSARRLRQLVLSLDSMNWPKGKGKAKVTTTEKRRGENNLQMLYRHFMGKLSTSYHNIYQVWYWWSNFDERRLEVFAWCVVFNVYILQRAVKWLSALELHPHKI